MTENTEPIVIKQIVVRPNGPYKVTGCIPLVKKIQAVSELGEPLTWKKQGELDATDEYYLCRCGQSSNKPFCDGTHRRHPYDGTEHAPTNQSCERCLEYPGGAHLSIYFDPDLCMESGFCANHVTSVAEMSAQTDDTIVRTQAIAMIEHCPSGALTYRLEGDEVNNEVDLPQQVAVTTEITAHGPIPGPLWVTGNIPILRADRQPFECRNRVTLCNCGRSHCKPLCDGAHRKAA